MSDYRDLAERYIATWNETDTERRRALIARTFADAASFVDPMMQGDGPDQIEALIAGVQSKYPGHRFRLHGKVDSHHDCVRFSWALVPPGGEAFVDGTDIALVAADGRMQKIIGFFDRLPAT